MNPWFITGFGDGEGCFWINVNRDNTYKTGWRVKLLFFFFKLTCIKKIKFYWNRLKNFFNVGKIYKYDSVSSRYFVTSVKYLQVIKEHFDKYPLHTQKRADFELFKQALDLIQNKEHLTTQGLQKIVAIRASINLGLSDELKVVFINK